MGQTRVDPRNHMEVHFDATRRIRSNSSCAATMQLCQITLTTCYASAHLMNKIVGIMFSGCPSLCACMQIRASLHTSQPLYLSELISHYLSSRFLRSSNTNLLTRPRGIISNFSSLSGLFCVCTFYLEHSTCTHSFCRHPIHL